MTAFGYDSNLNMDKNKLLQIKILVVLIKKIIYNCLIGSNTSKSGDVLNRGTTHLLLLLYYSGSHKLLRYCLIQYKNDARMFLDLNSCICNGSILFDMTYSIIACFYQCEIQNK